MEDTEYIKQLESQVSNLENQLKVNDVELQTLRDEWADSLYPANSFRFLIFKHLLDIEYIEDSDKSDAEKQKELESLKETVHWHIHLYEDRTGLQHLVPERTVTHIKSIKEKLGL